MISDQYFYIKVILVTGRLTGFKAMSTRLGLFYSETLRKRVHIYIFV